jgi:hypothetical protein
MYGVIVSESSMNKYNIFADPLCFEIKNRRQGPKTAGYRRKPAAISNPANFHTNCNFHSMDTVWELYGYYSINFTIFSGTCLLHPIRHKLPYLAPHYPI